MMGSWAVLELPPRNIAVRELDCPFHIRARHPLVLSCQCVTEQAVGVSCWLMLPQARRVGSIGRTPNATSDTEQLPDATMLIDAEMHLFQALHGAAVLMAQIAGCRRPRPNEGSKLVSPTGKPPTGGTAPAHGATGNSSGCERFAGEM
jgi:hypothetical protein